MCTKAIDDLIRRENELLGEVSAEGRSALCLSGGGIRSAAFSLGVLQALARAKWLSKFDYLSTVSGGGYIGSWLSAWIHRAPQGLAEVEAKLADPVESEALESLRATSNFLSPEKGLSADMLALVSTYIRNLLINWSVMLPLFVAAALGFTLLVLVHGLVAEHHSGWSPIAGRIAAMSALLIVSAYTASDIPWGKWHQTERSWFCAYGFVPIVAACVILSTCFFYQMQTGKNPVAEVYPNFNVEDMLFAVSLGVIAYAVGTFIGFVFFRPRRKLRGKVERESFDFSRFVLLLVTTTASAVAIVFAMAYGYELAYLIASRVGDAFPNSGVDDLRGTVLVMLAVPALLASFSIGNLFQIAISRRMLDDWAREWWARSGGAWLIAAGAWLFGILIFVVAPALLTTIPKSATAAGIGGIVTAILAYHSKTASPGTNAAKADSLMAKLSVSLLDIAAIAFILLLLMVAGLAARFIVESPDLKVEAMLAASVFAGLVGLSIFVAWIVGANRFSLNALYRLRLIRTFLGSSREERRPHAFTGFDPEDDLRLSTLKQRPLHLVNTAFNIHAAKGTKAERGSLQDRRAISFVFSAAGYGCDLWSARQVPDDITLGSAMAISGAAASPHMGYHTSKPISFVLAFFNLRLGWWLRRPDDSDMTESSEPHCPWRALRSEYFSHTTGRGRSVYLSDGGHFENLALYEALRRRCTRIVVVDAGCDPEFEFNDVERMLRLARIDLGIAIECERGLPTPATARDTDCHHALWKVEYPADDGESAQTGVILYIKPVISRDEPIDILRRAADTRTAKFPHEPTSDQFYDEAQFEAYRYLGLHSGKKAFDGRDFLDVNWLKSDDKKVKPVYPVWDRCRDARLLLNECEPAGRVAGMVESAKSLFQWESLPTTLAALAGAGVVTGTVLPNGSDFDIAIVAPPQEAPEISAVIIPMVPVLMERGGRFMLPIFDEASGCVVGDNGFACAIGDGQEIRNTTDQDGKPMREALGRLAERMAACKIDPAMVSVVGYSSSSDFKDAQSPSGSLEFNLRLADARAANVASALGTYSHRVAPWLSDPTVDIAVSYKEMEQQQVLDRSTQERFVRTAGGINRRVDIVIDNFGSCDMTHLIDVFLKTKPNESQATSAD